MKVSDRPELAMTRLLKTVMSELPKGVQHLCLILPEEGAWPEVGQGIPGLESLQASLARRRHTALGDTPVLVEMPGGVLASWVRVPTEGETFALHTRLREALKPLLAEHAEHLHIAAYGPAGFRARVLAAAAYCAWLNATPLPTLKTKPGPKALKKLTLQGAATLPALPRLRALAEANTLTRHLTLMPPNLLTPGHYRKVVAGLARQQGWQMTTYGLEKLRTLGAGAFVAVAQGSQQGSQPADAAIVKLVYDGTGKGKGSEKGGKKGSEMGGDIALVGKGICFDTGGHNLKPARYMSGMHEDMNGSAVVLGILLAATHLKLPLRLTAWLAVAENHLSPEAYTQNAVVTALNGTTIEVVHTDAEGRMVLADTLTLAARAKPDAILDFATLTGSMHTALGTRYSGVLSNREALLTEAVAAGIATGERVCSFPLAADYAPALDSEIADVKQCTLDGEADHILAALFLKRFVEDRPWLHMDLSASRCKEGLGAVASEVTGFGVAWGLEMLGRLRPHG